MKHENKTEQNETKTEIENLKLALNRATTENETLKTENAELEEQTQKKKTARLTSTQKASCFHISVSQMFSAKQLSDLFSNRIVSDNTKEVIFEKSMRDDLIKHINNKLHK